MAALETVGRLHGNRAHGVVAHLRSHLEHQSHAVALDLERVQNVGHAAVFKLHVNDGTHHLHHRADAGALGLATLGLQVGLCLLEQNLLDLGNRLLGVGRLEGAGSGSGRLGGGSGSLGSGSHVPAR